MSTDLDIQSSGKTDLRTEVQEWLNRFTAATASRDTAAIPQLFIPQAFWRDLLGFTWDIRSAVGIDAIQELVSRGPGGDGMRGLRLRDGSEPRMVDGGPMGTWLQADLVFDTEHGSGHGLLRLIDAGSAWLAMSLITELTSLEEVPRRTVEWADRGNPEWTTSEKGRLNGADSRDPNRPFPTTEPTVLVVGGGQCGLALAARLDHLGVDALVIERNERVGDSWRNRHYNLITHTPSFTDHLPYLPFPGNWPLCATKDRLADWIEGYANGVGIDVWTSTEMIGGSYDDTTGTWAVEIRRADGHIETVRPKHLVLATGLLSIPSVPELPGRDRFAGTVLHSSQYGSGADHVGKKVVVVGSGASGHDIAQDLYEHGVADVTMVQRSATYVMSFKNGVYANYGSFYSHESVHDLEAADRAFRSFPLPVAIEAGKASAPLIAEQDKDLLEGLRRVGFQLKDGGMLANGLTPSVGGYYINQGCSELLIEGKIALKNGSVVGFDQAGVLFEDGSRLDADVVVLCTGYKNMREAARKLIGESAWERCKQAWVLDTDRGGEHSNLWTDSGHPHLWFMAGSLHYARIYSHALGLRLKAEALNLVSD